MKRPHTSTGTLSPRQPFDFGKSLRFIERFPMTAEEQTTNDGVLTKAIIVAGQGVLFQVRASDRKKLEYTLRSQRTIDNALKNDVAGAITRYLGLNDDLTAFYADSKGDRPFAAIVKRAYGLHQVRFLTSIEVACWSILAQRFPVQLARKVKQRLTDACGDTLEYDGFDYPAFPETSRLAKLSPTELLKIVQNKRKAPYLYAVIQAWVTVTEEFLYGAPYGAVEEWLRSIDGIGPWSAAFIMLRGLGRTERLLSSPPLLEAASELYGRTISPSEFKSLAERYGESQGYWGFYLRAG